MEITYNEKTNLLYLRIDPKSQNVVNPRIDHDVVLDIGKEGKIIGIEIMNASKKVNLKELFPIKINNFEKTKAKH